MIVEKTENYIKACMQAWLFCESCIHAEVSSDNPKTSLIRECHECAQACFAVVCRLISTQVGIHDLALNCIIHCRNCQEECEKYRQIDDIKYCGDVCDYCAEKLKDIAVPAYSLN